MGQYDVIMSNLYQNRNPRARLNQKSVFVHDFRCSGSKGNVFKMVPSAILDLALWRKMPGFVLEGPRPGG